MHGEAHCKLAASPPKRIIARLQLTATESHDLHHTNRTPMRTLTCGMGSGPYFRQDTALSITPCTSPHLLRYLRSKCPSFSLRSERHFNEIAVH